MGSFSIVEVVLLAIVTFIFAIDQFSLTELIYRPMIACPIIGLINNFLGIGMYHSNDEVKYRPFWRRK